MHLQNSKIKVGVFGASSQVGSSLALYFKKYTELEPVCFIRSGYSRIFFEMFGIETQTVDFNNATALKDQLSNIDWVLDFTYPSGQVAEIPKMIKENTQKIIQSMQPHSNYIYMSSIMAHGMPAEEKEIKNYIFPRTSYAYIKRKAEQYTLKYTKENNITSYIFRLGQVHGFLQSVNASYRKKLTQNFNLTLNADKDDLSNTIFINSLGKAIENCIHQKVKPGTYTLVSNPQWSMLDLYSYYYEIFEITKPIEFIPDKRTKAKSFKGRLTLALKKLRPLIEVYFLMKFPSLSARIKGKYRVIETKSQINHRMRSFIDFHIIGKPPTALINNIDSEIVKVSQTERDLEEFYNLTLKKHSGS